MRKYSLSFLKRGNANLLFNCIREKGPLTRAELSRITGLTPSTVSYITSVLIDKGILIELGTEKTNRVGKKGILLDINYDKFLFIGYDVGSAFTRIAVCNGRSEILTIKRLKTQRGEKLIQQITDNILKVISDFKITGIGMAFPGHVDPENKTVIRSHNLNLKSANITQIVEEKFGIPTFIDHNVAIMARAKMFLNPSSKENFVMINLGLGVGAAFVHEGKIYRGKNFVAPEVGHLLVNPNGRRCNCGKIGCLETEASSAAIVKNYEELSGVEVLDKLNSKYVYGLAKEGDESAIKAFQRAGKYLGIAVGNLVNILNPAVVYIAGGVSGGWEFIKDTFWEFYKENTFYASKDIPVKLLPMKEEITAVGAAAYAFEKYIRSEIIRKV